ncbi:uncharacterized protein LTR77_001949 [Saxophila tyrrhenica]|uniref:Uncharacterized protein n=1 Tax=Saxophila tyrrhenica TaxID=1690608 RepID=A0AAV9PI25_9PEZI|nr:hypothetical protein LTR77_001949 [Saxophila tyrrhenica]
MANAATFFGQDMLLRAVLVNLPPGQILRARQVNQSFLENIDNSLDVRQSAFLLRDANDQQDIVFWYHDGSPTVWLISINAPPTHASLLAQSVGTATPPVAYRRYILNSSVLRPVSANLANQQASAAYSAMWLSLMVPYHPPMNITTSQALALDMQLAKPAVMTVEAGAYVGLVFAQTWQTRALVTNNNGIRVRDVIADLQAWQATLAAGHFLRDPSIAFLGVSGSLRLRGRGWKVEGDDGGEG